MTPEVKKKLEQIRHGNVPEGYRKTAVGIVPNDWKERRLADAVDFLDDRRIPIKENERISGKYPYYGASGVIDHVADYIFDGEYILLGEDGANIIERSTPLAFRVSGKCWINNHAHVLSPKDGYHIDYLTNYLESLSYVKYNSGTAQPKLNQDTCQKLPVVCGSFAEQKRIADIFTAQDLVIALKEKLLVEKQRQKKYLMQQLLTGNKRLAGFTEEWRMVTLRNVANPITEKVGKGQYEVLSISATKGFVNQAQKFGKDISGAQYSKYTVIRRGDFAYNKGNSKTYPQGCIYLLEDRVVAAVPNVFISFSLCSNCCNSYYKYLFENGYLNHQLYRLINSGVRNDGLLNLNDSDFYDCIVPMPPYEEQNAIAEILTTADCEIDLLKQELEAEKQKKKALMQLLLTGIVRVNA